MKYYGTWFFKWAAKVDKVSIFSAIEREGFVLIF